MWTSLQEHMSIITRHCENYTTYHIMASNASTTKIRVVYNASARCGGKFRQRIFNLLFRFRTYFVAFITDMEKAFLMIKMAENGCGFGVFVAKKHNNLSQLRSGLPGLSSEYLSVSSCWTQPFKNHSMPRPTLQSWKWNQGPSTWM